MLLPSINLSKGELQCLDESIRTEWLITNGLGGYASTTVLGLNTRKYHGLLVAALHPPANRTVCLAKLDDEAIVEGTVYALNSNEFRDRIFPQGYLSLRAFSISPFPRYIYATEVVEVEKTILMPQGKNVVAALYKIQTENRNVAIRVFPLLSGRHFHTVTNVNQKKKTMLQNSHHSDVDVTTDSPQVTIALSATEGEFKQRPIWVERLLYRDEAARGESCLDDCYQPGYFETKIPMKSKKEFAIVAAADESRHDALTTLEEIGDTTDAVNALLEKEAANREESTARFYTQHKQARVSDWLNSTLQATNTFVVEDDGDSRSIIAGYHWFEVWGRDAFISLPGLVLTTGRYEDAKRILLGSAKYVKNGLVPNFAQNKSSEPFYNTVDATLWFINAALQYLAYTGDFEFVRLHLWEKLKIIAERHVEGTAYGIHMDNDGLLMHGPQLTWMDSQIDDKAVTPRKGKAVEIQALWYNAVRTLEFLASKFEEEKLAQSFSGIATRAKESFNRKFWNSQKKCLFDTIGDSGADDSLRPNQIIAASLRYPIIEKEIAEPMLDVVHRDLLTPCGLRTLATSESSYVGVYTGDRRTRDQAYHNGTVWPWLLGPLVTAYLKTKGYSKLNREAAFGNLLSPLLSTQVYRAGLGTISEIFDGDPPHAPRGCISQAWSVAEPLRAYTEDVLQIRPKHEKLIL